MEDSPNMKFEGVYQGRYKEEGTIREYQRKRKNGNLNLKFLPSYPLPKPNITSLKDLTDLEG